MVFVFFCKEKNENIEHQIWAEHKKDKRLKVFNQKHDLYMFRELENFFLKSLKDF